MSGFLPLMPPNATPLERGLDRASARLDAVDVAVLTAIREAARCPADVLPWLANDVSIDAWDPAWSDAAKRAAIRLAIPLQRKKGTMSAIQLALQPFGGQAAIREWWQQDPPGEPHTFEVVLTLPSAGGAPVNPALIDAAVEQIARAKPARSHFTFTLGGSAQGGVGPVGRARPLTYARLNLASDQPLAA